MILNHVGVGGVALIVGLVVGVRLVWVDVAGVSLALVEVVGGILVLVDVVGGILVLVDVVGGILVLVEVVGGRFVLVEAGTAVVDLSFYEKGNRIIIRNAITEFNCNCLGMRILCYWESLNS